jgi:hypothetical protein
MNNKSVESSIEWKISSILKEVIFNSIGDTAPPQYLKLDRIKENLKRYPRIRDIKDNILMSVWDHKIS